MASGVNKSKIAADKKNWNGRAAYPYFERSYRAPSAKQIAFLKNVWQQLSEHGYEYSYDRRALIEQHRCAVEINRDYAMAKKLGITFVRRADDATD